MSRNRNTDVAYRIIVLAVLAALVAGGLVLRAEAPCSWFSLVPAKDVPARCLMHR
jgi:hypothetical protein